MPIIKQGQLKLSINLAFLGLIFIVLIFLLGWMNHYRQQQAHALAIQKRSLELAKQTLKKVKNELAVLAEYGPHYAILLDQAKRHEGLLNPTNNQAWISQLQAQQKNLQLFNIGYSMDLTDPLKPSFISAYANLPVRLSAISLDFDMLHEEDLLQLTDALAAHQSAVIIWRDCEITRLHPGPWSSSQLKANLHSKCRLDSLSMDKLLARQGMLP
ncbi:hypothetical protein MCETRH20_01503 [Methylophilaceae bacterium]